MAIASTDEQKKALVVIEWNRLALYSLHHFRQYHVDTAQLINVAGNQLMMLSALRMVSSSDPNFKPILTEGLSNLCDLFAPGEV